MQPKPKPHLGVPSSLAVAAAAPYTPRTAARVHLVLQRTPISAPRPLAEACGASCVALRAHPYAKQPTRAPVRPVRDVAPPLYSSCCTHARVQWASRRAWPFLRTARRALAAETNSLQKKKSLRCPLTRAWSDASPRIELLSGIARVRCLKPRRARKHCFKRAVWVVIVTHFIATHRKTQR